MPRKSQNPLEDIVGTVGGWLGSSAKSLNTFLTGDKNPTLNPQTRAGIRAMQEIGEQTTGGAVSAMQKGPDAVQRYVMTQAAVAAASAGVGAVAPMAISKAAQTKAGQAVANKAADIAFGAKMLKPVTARTVREQQKKYLQRIMQAESRAMEAEAQMELAEKLVNKKYPDMDYVKLFKQSLIEDDARRISMEKGLESTPFTRSGQNAARIEAAKNPFLKTSEDVDRDIRLTNRYLREKGKWVSMRSRALAADPEYRRQINDAIARQLAKSKGKRAMDEVMKNIVDEGLQDFK